MNLHHDLHAHRMIWMMEERTDIYMLPPPMRYQIHILTTLEEVHDDPQEANNIEEEARDTEFRETT